MGVRASRIVEEAPRDELSAIFGERKQYRAQNEGSGVIIDVEGYIVTNYHVVRQASEVEVDLADGRVVPATVVGADKLSDMAVLKIQADGLEAASWGDSDKLEVGDPVLAIGNPFRLMPGPSPPASSAPKAATRSSKTSTTRTSSRPTPP